MRYEDYIANLARLAVELANGDGPTAFSDEMFGQHRVDRPTPAELAALLAELRPALAAVADGGPLAPVNAMLEKHPPRLHISDHDGLGAPHLHHAYDGEPALDWLARGCGAALAHIACGVPEVVLGRCGARGCPNFFVDASRNHSRRFCGNTCASRTTVAAHRSRARGG
ncbi:CGNR zinc finger domain-containing protein [Longispora sp. K20-0274]|uniref:CGNR zinc finger domain-containing protein n=1 Tax=Longispora sp. K20-0274 TaxID=3088255 RepID=UPI00399ACBB5